MVQPTWSRNRRTRKLKDFGRKTETDGTEPGSAVEGDLNKAWTNAQVASVDLQTAGAEDWESTKTSFEKATRELAKTWDKIRLRGRLASAQRPVHRW